MTVISTANDPKLLWPGLNKIWGMNYKDPPKYYTDLFDTFSSDMNYEEDQELSGFGLVPVKQQGAAIAYDTHGQRVTSRYTHIAYAMGFIVTREEMDDNLYLKRGSARTKALARSFRITKEIVAANVYNRAHTAGYVGGDAVVLASASHPTDSGNQSNTLAVAADLSEASLEDIAVQISNAVDSRGLKIALQPKSLIIPTALQFEAARILRSVGQNDTANNAINALKAMGVFSEGAKVNPFLTDTDAFYVRTDATDGMKMFQRIEAEFAQDGDFDTYNVKYKGYERYSTGWSDFRGVFTNGGGA
jgi:hypothetical protein